MLPGIDGGTGCGVVCFPLACSGAVTDAAGCACGTVKMKKKIHIIFQNNNENIERMSSCVILFQIFD